MGQRNMPCTSQMIDLEMDQQNQGYMLREPCVVMGGVPSFPQPMQTMVRASGNTSSLDAHQRYDGTMLYGMPHYPGVHHHHAANFDLVASTASNLYVPYMPNPSSGMPINHGSSDHLPSSSNFGVIGFSADEYGRNSHYMDHVRGSYKRKNTEVIPGSFQYINAPASSSLPVAPSNTRLPDGVAPVDAASFPVPQFRGSGNPPIRDIESQRSVRNRSGATAMDPVLAHSHNHFFQGNYIGQPFQPNGSLWLDQHSDGGASAWTQAPNVPYMHGGNLSSTSMESGNMVLQRFPETAGSRSSSTFLHTPPVNIQHHSFHSLSPPIQGARSHNINVHPQVAAAAASYRGPSNYVAHNGMNPSPQDGLEMMPRPVGPVPPTGIRLYWSQRGPMPEATLRQRNLPHLRVLPSDGVAMLEMPDFYEVGNLIDHHRDMRLDIEDMSYEELLALGERIGNVNTGLSEEAVTSKLKIRTYISTKTDINLEAPASMDQESDSCIICQEGYKSQEKIGTLDCGHEYHEECLKKWLYLKNVCPICKSEALATKTKVA
ncbi:probable E3 ubiquitin-protein ligase ZFP1 [Mangifera indica]|uniref:probable E3 ubiquitin-protein ligase ZFP1 n=1 Tax=Mangifera indica TaxID=29780 RepID=UPI001CF980A8|nr:probable E3 ubiquitin-protein ligase ZFP1 [Mangifera indica]XP_044479247.1 probable E3 ubiquitin-protein ligase ZFP1 [Mangifera indica]